jgi:hypothetical protein
MMVEGSRLRYTILSALFSVSISRGASMMESTCRASPYKVYLTEVLTTHQIKEKIHLIRG